MIEKIGTAIKASRKLQGLSLDELSARAGISRGTLAKIETGSGNPRISSIVAITCALRLSFRIVFGTIDEKPPKYPPGSW